MKLYDSLGALAMDSQLIVIGEVRNSTPVPVPPSDSKSDPHTVSGFVVKTVLAGSGVGPLSQLSPVSVTKGQSIAIRQSAVVGQQGKASQSILKPGATYLLFLVPSGLPGAEANQFYPTGGTAGVWVGDGLSFAKVADEGDRLPSVLRSSDISSLHLNPDHTSPSNNG